MYDRDVHPSPPPTTSKVCMIAYDGFIHVLISDYSLQGDRFDHVTKVTIMSSLEQVACVDLKAVEPRLTEIISIHRPRMREACVGGVRLRGPECRVLVGGPGHCPDVLPSHLSGWIHG